MVSDTKLSAVLSDLAQTLISDFPIQAILDQLVDKIVDALPVTSAGITLISDGSTPHYIAASDDSALQFEQFQTAIGDGPCVMAHAADVAVSAPDLSIDDRFPDFAPRALEAGLAAVFAFPLRHGDERLGALDLYSDTVGVLGAEEMEAAQMLADVAAAYLLNADARERARAMVKSAHHDSVHDPLTGLPNRLLFEERLEHVAQRALRLETCAGVLFMDLDRFKEVNDTFGHQAGDELLVAVARRLSTLIRSSDTLARFSGDEFVFLFEDINTEAEVALMATRIENAFAEPFVLCDGLITLEVSASIGAAFAGATEDISKQLVNVADMAMYKVKVARREVRMSALDRQGRLEVGGRVGDDGAELEIDLRAALSDQDLDVAYQPIVAVADGRVVGVEALLRWDHPLSGPRAASKMIQVAERSRLIVDIGAWILERSCRDRVRWLHDYPGVPMELSVNVSACQLLDPAFVETVDDVLRRTEMDPAALILEITESVFVEEAGLMLEALTDLKERGIRLAIDDFGAGYSSLGYLARLPVDIIKIDGSLVAEIGPSSAAHVIVTAIVDLAHQLGLTVTAEGIESALQRDEIRSVGCDQAQGYLYAHPASATVIEALLGALNTGFIPPRDEALLPL